MATTWVQHGTPATCNCVIAYACECDLALGSLVLTPTSIIHNCEVPSHAEITDAEALHDITAAECLPLAHVRAIITKWGGTLINWIVRDDNSMVWVLVGDQYMDPFNFAEMHAELDGLADVDVHYGDEGDIDEIQRDIGDPFIPDVVASVTGGKRLVQGSRFNGIDTQRRDGLLQSYFQILGHGDLEMADNFYFSADSEKRRLAFAYTTFDLYVSRLTIRTVGNERPDPYLCSIRTMVPTTSEVGGEEAAITFIIDDQDEGATTQFVIIPPEWDGEMVCQAEPTFIEFGNNGETGNLVFGRCDGASTGEDRFDVGLWQASCWIETGSKYRCVNMATVAGGNGFEPESGYNYSPHLLDGPIYHYNNKVMNSEETLPYADTDLGWMPNALSMRAHSFGSYSKWNITQDAESTPAPVIILRKLSEEPVDLNTGVPALHDVAGDQVLCAILHNEKVTTYSSADEEPPDLSWLTLGGGPGQEANLWRVQCQFEAEATSGGVDWQIGENWGHSWIGPGKLTEIEDVQSDFITLRGETPYRTTYVSLLGSYQTLPEFKSSAAIGHNDLVRRDYEVTFPAAKRFTFPRGFVQANADGRSVELAVYVGGVVQETFRCELRDAGLSQNIVDHIDVPANTPVCLAFIGPDNFDHARAQIPQIAITINDAPDSRECLVRVLPDAVPVEPLPCATAFARCVRIQRADGQVFAYTDHDKNITSLGTTYRKCGAFAGSATELGAVIGEVGNMEIRGATRDLGIKVADLFGGLFDGADVDVFLIPWKPGDTQPIRRIGGGTVGTTTQVGKAFVMEALSPSAMLRQRSLSEVVTMDCRLVPVGSPRCGVHIASMAVSGTVTSVSVDAQNDATVRRRFSDSSRVEATGTFAEGIITFLTGENAGQISKVKAYGGPTTGEIVLWEPLVYEIQVGDTYTMTPGCDGLPATCKTVFNNYDNFGGYEYVPGTDATSETPEPKDQ